MSEKEEDTDYRNYIDKDEYAKEILKCQQTDEVSERLGELFLLHAQNKTYSSRFINYTWTDDMIGRAVVQLCSYVLDNFDPDKGNAWSYCDRIIYYAFVQIIKKEKKQSKIKQHITESYQDTLRDHRKNMEDRAETLKRQKNKDEEN